MGQGGVEEGGEGQGESGPGLDVGKGFQKRTRLGTFYFRLASSFATTWISAAARARARADAELLLKIQY